MERALRDSQIYNQQHLEQRTADASTAVETNMPQWSKKQTTTQL